MLTIPDHIEGLGGYAALDSIASVAAQHHPVTLDSATTIADGIAVRRAGEVTFPVIGDKSVAFGRDDVRLGQAKLDHAAVFVALSRIERGLVQDGRLIRLRIHLLDKPGALAELTRLIADHRANIVDTLHNRAYYGVLAMYPSNDGYIA